MPPLPTLVCKACGYVNEGERVYCHGCGAKLDRASLIARQPPAVAPEQKQREVRKIMTPKKSLFPGFWKNLAQTLALAVLAGALVNAALPPEGVPASPKKGADLAIPPQIDMVLENLAIATSGQQKAFSEAELNAYLQKEHFRKVPPLLTSLLPPQRVFVHLGEGTGRLSVEATLANHPLYASLSGRFQPDASGKWTAVCTGGAIGRLPIHPALACYATGAVPVLLDSVKRDIQFLEKLGSVQITPGQLTLGAPKMATAPPPPLASPALSRPAVTR